MEWNDKPEGCPKYYDESSEACQNCQITDKCMQDTFKRFMGKLGKDMENQGSATAASVGLPGKRVAMDNTACIDKFLDVFGAIKDRAGLRGMTWDTNETLNATMYYLMHFYSISSMIKTKTPEMTIEEMMNALKPKKEDENERGNS